MGYAGLWYLILILNYNFYKLDEITVCIVEDLDEVRNGLAAIINMLYGSGARQFLVPNLPDLSLTPYGLSLSPADKAGLEALSIGFNAGLAGAVTGLSFLPGIDIELFDTFSLFNAILADPGAFGVRGGQPGRTPLQA